MERRTFIGRVGLAGLLAVGALRAAPLPAPPIDVQAVRFALAAPAGAPARWLEIAVTVNVRSPASRGRYLDRVRVTLSLGTRAVTGGHRYYRSELEAVALENGPADFRFYLPPEVVQRDGLGGEAEFWSVAIAAGGETVPGSPRSASVSLRHPDVRLRFEASQATEAPANDGVLVPQYLTPFADQYPGRTPSPVRYQ